MCSRLVAPEHLFDTGRVARPVLNLEKPPSIPQRPMGSIPVVVRLVRPDGEEWWPAAFDRTLPPSEALGRIRDQFRSYDEGGIA